MRYFFSRLRNSWEITNRWEILSVFRNFSQDFLRKLPKIHYIAYFSKKSDRKNMRQFVALSDANHKMLGNFKIFLKIFDKNLIGKLNFNYFWKGIEPSEITSFFYNIFPLFVWGTFPIFPPPLAPPISMHSLTSSQYSYIYHENVQKETLLSHDFLFNTTD